MSNQLEWQTKSLGELAKWSSGGTPSRSNKNYYGGSIPWLKTGDLGPRYVRDIPEFITEEGLKNSSAKLFPKGSVGIAMYGATIGKVSIFDIDAACNQACAVAQPHDQIIDREFLYYLLKNEKEAFIAKGKGGAQPNISQKIIKEHEVKIPNVDVQHKIVEKLDSVLAKVEAAQARLNKIPTILKRFRQSVLAAATSGELTKDWREENDVRLKVFPKDVENDAYDVWKNTTDRGIPSSWHYFKLYELGSIKGGGTPRKSIDDYWNGEVPWVTPKDMKVDFISTSKLKVTDFGVKNSSAKYIDKNSLLFVVRGMILAHSFPVAKTLEQVTVNQDMKALTPIEQVNPDYLLYSLKSLAQVFVELASSSTHGTKRLEAKMYNNVAIPVPPLEEQFKIVQKVKELLEHADTVEKQYNAAKARVDKLTQSILAKAFRGELVEY
ncbi:restriction endonuclease subunit S [Pseudoalteromonas rubra]|uniref:restriction endonuclease subunit S n=1 Tax=Pseudoalteromonas rubra TaxID=43658 RepID=UPI002DB74E2E|nr:restriction endonuclease subunit S [Pseudoalteromonas rubra]MEC4087191.1 restriction endonuclease subunit S [Pseudoalteromonas rubra]